MSTTATAKKRKSVDSTVSAAKKVKMAKSADKPAPLKSALKTSKTATITQAATSNGVVKKKKKKPATKPLPIAAEDVDEKEELTPDQTAALLAGFSSDSDNEAEEEEGIALSSLPKPPTPNLLSTSAAAEDDADPETTPAVLYIGRIPHGFYEPQMHAYFSQFGSISQLRLARNKKTGKSQHYAFVEFGSAAVADIVRRTMDKYLLFGHILQVRAVPAESVRENMFAGAGRRARRKAPRNRMEGRMLEKGVGRDVWATRLERERERRRKKGEVLAELGYQFEMPSLKGVEDVPVKVKEVEDRVELEGDEGGVQLVTKGVNEEKADGSGVVVEEEMVTKKRSASGKTEVRKKVKKVKA